MGWGLVEGKAPPSSLPPSYTYDGSDRNRRASVTGTVQWIGATVGT